MGQVFIIALGGGFGAVLRFLISNGVYNSLGREFPYGTLAVNLIGSLLMGLLTAALVVEKVALSAEYRPALLVGFLGSLTTFSTFSLDTFSLLQQGEFSKAGLNISLNVLSCLVMVWLGLFIGKGLFSHTNGFFEWQHWHIPYGLIILNLIIALLIGLIASALLKQTSILIEYQAAILFIIVGTFITFSGLYLCLHLLAIGYQVETHLTQIITLLLFNLSLCGLALTLGFKGSFASIM
jgi:CrcB protein